MSRSDPVARVVTLAERQGGVVALRQLTDLGADRHLVRAQVRAGRWRNVHPGVVAVHTGPLADLTRCWAAALVAGPDAVLGYAAAAWLWGLQGALPPTITVAVPHGRPVRRACPGVRLVQSRALVHTRHPVAAPPRTTVEATVLDLVHDARTEQVVVDLVLHACHGRMTTPARLHTEVRRRTRLRWRSLVLGLLGEVQVGVASPLELRYVRDVERAHRLPTAERNRGEGPPGRRRYRDVRYRRWKLVVELDGRAAHPEHERELDDLRDNDVTEQGERTLRYGWRSVTGRPCLVAAQVAALLRQAGWPGPLAACGPSCPVAARPADAIRVGSDALRIR